VHNNPVNSFEKRIPRMSVAPRFPFGMDTRQIKNWQSIDLSAG
jgi:hypothetical protein